MVLRMLGSAVAVIGGSGSSRTLLASRATATTGSTIGSSRAFVGSRGVSPALSAFVRSPVARTDRSLSIQKGGLKTTPSSTTAVVSAERPGSTWAATAAAVSVGGSIRSHAAHYRQQQQQQWQGVTSTGVTKGQNRLMSTRDGSGDGGDAGFWNDDDDASSYAMGEGRTVGGVNPAYMSSSSGAGGADVGEPVGLSQEDDEGEWMAGADVDPEAEAIFYGDKVPFSDLGEKQRVCWGEVGGVTYSFVAWLMYGAI